MYFSHFDVYSNNAHLRHSWSDQTGFLGFHGSNAFVRINQYDFYVKQYHDLRIDLYGKSFDGLKRTCVNLDTNPDYEGARSSAVQTAWEYEKADIIMGGSGSEGWTTEERQQILKAKYGSGLPGAEGHHRKNVHDHREEQWNPDNIKFFRTRKEHLEAHGGDFHNETDMPLCDRKEMLRQTQRKRVIQNEVKGATISAIVGFMTSASLSLIAELYEKGFSLDTAKDVITNVFKQGLAGACNGTVSYGVFRLGSILIDQSISPTAKGFLGFLRSTRGKFAILGAVAIIGDSLFLITKDTMNGSPFLQSVVNTGKRQMIPIGLLALSLYNPFVGFFLSSLISFCTIISNNAEKKLLMRIEIHRLDFLYQLITTDKQIKAYKKYRSKCPICGHTFTSVIEIDDFERVYECTGEKGKYITTVSLTNGNILESINTIIARNYHCPDCCIDWNSDDTRLEGILRRNWEAEYKFRYKKYPPKPDVVPNAIELYWKDFIYALFLSGAVLYTLASFLLLSWFIYLISLTFCDFTSFAWFLFSKGFIFGIVVWFFAGWWKYKEYLNKVKEYEKMMAIYEQNYKAVAEYNAALEKEMNERITTIVKNKKDWVFPIDETVKSTG